MTPYGAVRSDLTTESRLTRRRAARSALILLAAAFAAAAPRAQFTSGVNVVEVYATVTDAAGNPVTGLAQQDFTVRENGEPQQISAFVAGDFPLSAAIAIDRSFSMSGDRLATAKSAARVFLGELRPADESMLLGIGSRVEVLAPLSRDRAPQLTTLASLDAFGTTGLYDAVVAAIEAIQPARGRKALVLLSDGDDRYSTATAAEALDRARRSDVIMYPVALGRTRPQAFAELATLTGGRSFHVRDARTLPDTLRRIAQELRQQYLLGYSPSTPIVAGSNDWRAISVTVQKPGVTVRARDGYVAK